MCIPTSTYALLYVKLLFLLFFLFFFYLSSLFLLFFFFNDPATTEIYTLSLHDALPISTLAKSFSRPNSSLYCASVFGFTSSRASRSEETRLNSSHMSISYAVFCLKKKKKKKKN